MRDIRCLVLDHDDTVVRSEETVNFPAFQAALQQLRPGGTAHAQGIFSAMLPPRLFRHVQ